MSPLQGLSHQLYPDRMVKPQEVVCWSHMPYIAMVGRDSSSCIVDSLGSSAVPGTDTPSGLASPTITYRGYQIQTFCLRFRDLTSQGG